MPVIVTADRAVASVTATGSEDWQVVSTPTGFRGITSADFADNDKVAGFVIFENGEDYEVYDSDDDSTDKLLEISNISGTVTIARPTTPYKSSNGGARVTAGAGTHTLVVGLGSGSAKRVFRETNTTISTFTSGDATPSVADYRFFKTNGSTPITAFDDMESGKLFAVRRGDADIDLTHGASIVLPGAQNITLTADEPAAWFWEEAGVAYWIAGAGSIRADLASTANGKGASLVGLEDAASVFSAADVEAAFLETRKNAYIDGGTVAVDGNNEITVAPRRRYQLTASDSIAGVIGLADGEFCQIIAPASGSTTLQDAGTVTSGLALELSGANLVIESTDESVYTISRVGSAIRIAGGGGSGGDFSSTSSQATAAALADVSDAVNTSGKRLGTARLDTTNHRLYFATGSAAADPWRPVDDPSGIGDITPA